MTILNREFTDQEQKVGASPPVYQSTNLKTLKKQRAWKFAPFTFLLIQPEHAGIQICNIANIVKLRSHY